MNDLLIISFRTVFLYILILVILRIMGKREVGELGLLMLLSSLLWRKLPHLHSIPPIRN